MNSVKKRQIIDTIQWILIIGLVTLCCFIYEEKKYHPSLDIDKKTEDTYIKIHDSKRIAELEHINQTLYDSIKVLHNVESAVEIRYKYKIKTDTIRVAEFIHVKDSVYEYTDSNDTITTNISIKAKDLEWCNVETSIDDKFTIINQEKDGINKTTINYSNNVEINSVDAWRKKDKWYKKIYHGPSIGVGYGFINRKPDIYIGYSIGLHF